MRRSQVVRRRCDSRVRNVAFRLVIVLVVVAAVEAGSFAALAYLSSRQYVYKVPRVTHELSYDTRLRIGDPFLGWPLKEGRDAPGGAYRDREGARRVPAFPNPGSGPACVSMYGDSFVESYEVDAEHAAANLLARALDCRVANFGQGGYGTDQAYLRYLRNVDDRAGVVILGHMLENIRRNLGRNRDLVSGGRDYNLKPRFILGSGNALVLVPMPVLTEEEYERTIGQRLPLLPLVHESFQPGGELVGPMPAFPFSVSLMRNIGNYGIRARIRGHYSAAAQFYEPDHPTGALQLTFAILQAFHRDAKLRGQDGRVLLLPAREDLTYHQRTGVWVHRALLELLDRERIPYMDFAPYLSSQRDLDLEAYFTRAGHYNDRGDALLAQFLARELRRRGRSPILR